MDGIRMLKGAVGRGRYMGGGGAYGEAKKPRIKQKLKREKKIKNNLLLNITIKSATKQVG